MTLLYRRLSLLLAHLLQPDSLLSLSQQYSSQQQKGLNNRKTKLVHVFSLGGFSSFFVSFSWSNTCVSVWSQMIAHPLHKVAALLLTALSVSLDDWYPTRVLALNMHLMSTADIFEGNSKILAKRNTYIVCEYCAWIIDGIGLLKNASPTFLSHRERKQ